MLYDSLDRMESEFIMSPFYPGFLTDEQQAQVKVLPAYPIAAAAHSLFQCDALITQVRARESEITEFTLCNKIGSVILTITGTPTGFSLDTPFGLPKRNLQNNICKTNSVSAAVKSLAKYMADIQRLAAEGYAADIIPKRVDAIVKAVKTNKTYYRGYGSDFSDPDATLLAIEEFTKPGSTILSGYIKGQVDSALTTLKAMQAVRQERIERAEVFLGTDRWGIELTNVCVRVTRWSMEGLLGIAREFPYSFVEQMAPRALTSSYVERTPPRIFPTMRDLPGDIRDSVLASMTLVRESEKTANPAFPHSRKTRSRETQTTY